MSDPILFVSGAITLGYVVAGLFFFRFWRGTQDSLFLVFAVAFWLFALNQGLVALLGLEGDERGWLYLIRLAAFVLIIAAILGKNLGARPRR